MKAVFQNGRIKPNQNLLCETHAHIYIHTYARGKALRLYFIAGHMSVCVYLWGELLCL